MSEKPIQFSGSMVRAILDGRKTQTRRVLKTIGDLDRVFQMDDGSWHQTDSQGGHMTPVSIKFHVGDLLWVKEPLQATGDGGVCFTADGAVHPDAEWVWKRWALPAMFCRKGLSRIALRVTAVRVERLQDISEDDAKAEGVDKWGVCTWKDYSENGITHVTLSPRDSFLSLWTSIYGNGSWEENPWVAVYTFETEKP